MEETVRMFTEAGFKFETIERVVQQICSGLKELAARTRLRTDTTLALMTDDQFSGRQAALEAAAVREAEPTPVFETLDLLVLRRRAD
jgi:hypothetical protein